MRWRDRGEEAFDDISRVIVTRSEMLKADAGLRYAGLDQRICQHLTTEHGLIDVFVHRFFPVGATAGNAEVCSNQLLILLHAFDWLLLSLEA
jgi:hypothetical protein